MDQHDLLGKAVREAFPEAEEALRERQAEIEALNVRLARAMQETHHRVKNNFQVIPAIIDMEHRWRTRRRKRKIAADARKSITVRQDNA